MKTKKTKFILFLYLGAIIFLVSGFTKGQKASEEPQPPVAEKIKKELTAHGQTRIDDYYWLRERENPKVLEYLKAENEYTDAIMKHTEALEDALYKEIVGRIKQTDMSVPYRDNGYYYYARTEQGKEYPIYCRTKENLEAPEEILLNVPEMAKGHNYFLVVGLAVSPNNNLLSYGEDTEGRFKFTLHFKDLTTGQVFRDQIPNTSWGGAVWANNNKTVFYTLKDETTLRSFKILKHVLGSDTSSDKEVFVEKDETFDTWVEKSKSKKYIFIGSSSILSSECRYLDANNPDGEFRIIQPREKNLEYSVEHFKDKFYIRTNYKAKNFRLMETPVSKTTKEKWTEFIPHREDVLLEEFVIFDNFLVMNERKNGLTRLRIIPWEGKAEHYLDFGEETYSAWPGANPEFDTDILRYEYSSLTTPHSIFDYNMITKEKTLLKREDVLGGFDPANYHAERLSATASDGTKVPISLVYRKGLVENGNNPLLLDGYGSYGASSDPYFSSESLSLLDRGFVYAIAHVRGGGEMGRQWYEDGKLLKKKNTFTDFIACAEYLINEKFTNPQKLFATGVSAGGLLIGAVVNMRPDLFKGVIAGYPWVDALTSQLDSSLPLVTGEYDEWGNPNQKEYYDYMLSYSPYDNIERKAYPAMLVITALPDSQCQYWESAKWVAKLRTMKTDQNPLLLRVHMEAHHGGPTGRYQKYKETAFQYAFLLDLAGISK